MQAKLRCAIYTRVSTDNQAEVEFNSCEAQEAKIRSFIQSQENMGIYKVYSDPGFTGANLNRPGLNEMLADIKTGKNNLIISYKIDRLTRSPKDFYQLVDWFDKYGVDFISVTERFDTSTPAGRLLRNIMLTFAQFERELASERTRDKMLQRAQKGMWNGGIVPMGYSSKNKKLIINIEEAKIVRSVYEKYISGVLFSEISNHTGLSKSRIFTILRNPIYIGKIQYAGKFSQGDHEPIILNETYNLAQAVHKKKVRKLRLYKDYLLAGLIICKECGSHLTPCHTNKTVRNRLRRYYYYRCTSTFKRDWNNCGTRQVSADRLENFVLQNLERIALDKHYIDGLIFQRKFIPSGDRKGLEPTQSCVESSKNHGEFFAQTLENFVKSLPEKKGIDKNLLAKKLIKQINYSKEEIALTIYYKSSSEKATPSFPSIGWVGAADGRDSISGQSIKTPHTQKDMRGFQDWLLIQIQFEPLILFYLI